MSHFDQAFTELLGNEGGYSNNSADPGKETMWGVTADVAFDAGYVGPMRDMPVDIAKRIYAEKYWVAGFDKLPYKVAFALFDAAVNSGVGQAIRWLQRSLHVADDGKLGPITLSTAMQADPEKLLLAFNGERLDFMTRLSTWPVFGRGWSRRIASNLKKGAA